MPLAAATRTRRTARRQRQGCPGHTCRGETGRAHRRGGLPGRSRAAASARTGAARRSRAVPAVGSARGSFRRPSPRAGSPRRSAARRRMGRSCRASWSCSPRRRNGRHRRATALGERRRDCRKGSHVTAGHAGLGYRGRRRTAPVGPMPAGGCAASRRWPRRSRRRRVAGRRRPAAARSPARPAGRRAGSRADDDRQQEVRAGL